MQDFRANSKAVNDSIANLAIRLIRAVINADMLSEHPRWMRKFSTKELDFAGSPKAPHYAVLICKEAEYDAMQAAADYVAFCRVIWDNGGIPMSFDLWKQETKL